MSVFYGCVANHTKSEWLKAAASRFAHIPGVSNLVWSPLVPFVGLQSSGSWSGWGWIVQDSLIYSSELGTSSHWASVHMGFYPCGGPGSLHTVSEQEEGEVPKVQVLLKPLLASHLPKASHMWKPASSREINSTLDATRSKVTLQRDKYIGVGRICGH